MIAPLLLAALLQAPSDSAAVLCLASRPSATPLDTVELRVITDPGGAPRARRWRVSEGELLGRDSTVRWALARSGVGLQTATVELAGAGPAVRCTVRVMVVPPGGNMAGLRPARSYLAPGEHEEPGYAVYSYLLLGGAPDSGSRARYRAAIERYVALAPDIEAFQDAQRAERGAFNMNYLPVTARVGQPRPDSVLKYYDYATAAVLLQRLPGAPRLGGPYLVSVRGRPLAALDTIADSFSEQDLSTVPMVVVGPWVEHFLNLAAQQRFDGVTLQGFLLRARTLIGIAALGLPDVTSSLARWNEQWGKLVTVKP